MGLLDFPEKVRFIQNEEVKKASYVFKNKEKFVAAAKNNAKLKELSHKAILKISKSKNGFFVIEPNSRFGKINHLRYADITGVWKAVRYWKDFGIKVGGRLTQGHKTRKRGHSATRQETVQSDPHRTRVKRVQTEVPQKSEAQICVR